MDGFPDFQNVIFIASEWCEVCKYYVNSMVIACTTCQKKRKNAFGLDNWFTLSCRSLKFVVIYAPFPPNQYSQNFRVHKKMVFSKSGPGLLGPEQILCLEAEAAIHRPACLRSQGKQIVQIYWYANQRIRFKCKLGCFDIPNRWPKKFDFGKVFGKGWHMMTMEI